MNVSHLSVDTASTGGNPGMNRGSAIGTRNNMRIIDQIISSDGGLKVEILQYDELLGETNTQSAQKLWFMSQCNIKARQVAIYINNNSVKIEPGAMSYFQGNLEMISGVTVTNMLGRAISGMLTGEKMAMPEYRGSGILVLEPSFKHFILAELGPGESIITDKGMFYCAQSSVTVEPILNSKISSALLGGEGIFQTHLRGPGVIVLESPVPMCEINMLHIDNDILRVDGNFALLRTGNISFTVERSAVSLVGSAMSGEGLVNVFKGTGDVWIAPTLKVYDAIRLSSIMAGELSDIDMNTSTGKSKLK